MRTTIQELFANYFQELLFLHILSAVFWVGGMLVLKFVVQPSVQKIQDDSTRVSVSLNIIKKFLLLNILPIITLVVTAVIFIIGFNFKEGSVSVYRLVMTKEAVWVIMVIVFAVIYYRTKKAEKLFSNGNIKQAKASIIATDKIIYINIFLGLFALYLGIIL